MKTVDAMRMMKSIGALLLLVLMGTGCSNKRSSTITISSWEDVKGSIIMADMVDSFNKAHPETKVVVQRVEWHNYNTKLFTQIAADIAPDIIYVSTDNIADIYPRGILEPLDDYAKADNYSLNDYYPSILQRFTVEGHLYVMPRDVSPICMVFFNKKAFDEAKLPYPTDDWDWDEFLADAKALTKKDAEGRTTRWGYTEDWPMIEPWVYSNGGRWVDNIEKPTKYTFNTPAFVDAVHYRADLVLKHKVMPGPSNLTALGGLGTSDLFANGSAAMFLSGGWKVPQFREIKDFDWDVAMFPKTPKGGRGFAGGGSGYGLLKTSKNKKMAWEFIKYISGPEGTAKMAAAGLLQPALKSVAESPAYLDGGKPANRKMLLKAMDHEVYQPFSPIWFEVYQGSVIPAEERIWTGKLTVQQALDQLEGALKTKPLAAQPAKN